jgi:signal transduction histidine kinase/CheY-like chemotaxis protein
VERFDIWDEAGGALAAAELPARRALRGERAAETTLRFRVRATGEERWSQVKANPVFDERGQVQLAISIFRDITERKRAEEERERLLANEQAARVKAEEASRLKDEFLSVVSHELRTPLNAILGWVTLLETGKVGGDAARRALETIGRNARAQARIVEDVLDVSSIVTGRMRLDVTAVDVPPLVASVLDTFRPAAEAKGVTLKADYDREAGTLTADPHRLRQIVWNLLSNALRFTPGGGRVEVRVGRADSQVEITVSDTGQGISPDFLPFVFDRFRQADSSTTRTFGGLGLGLSIVRQLAELHGGEVSAASPGAGQGSTFKVRLPVTAESRVQSAAADNRGAAYSGLPVDLRGLKVLVVDDEADMLELLSTVLAGANAEVKSVSSAAEALSWLKDWSPDVLVSDIGMPQVDGYELIREVRASGASVPAVALTAYARGEDRVRALAAGYQRHVAKPVEPTELTVVVAGLAGRNT